MLLLPFLLVLGLFLPGYLIARGWRDEMAWASGFVFSLVILFHGVFWLGVLHVRLSAWTVAPVLAAVSAVAWWCGKNAGGGEKKSAGPWSWTERVLLGGIGLVGAVVVAHCAIAPLTGPDSVFRWDFLAQRILALGRFDFYPPVKAADFRNYFYPDGIPPMVAFTHWWMYASAGARMPWVICLFVGAQFACTAAFVYGAASSLYSRRAGVFAAAMVAGAPLYLRSIALAQETGLTALAVAAMLYFLVMPRKSGNTAAMAAAGMAAGLCALAREYGWVALLIGVVTLVWRREPLKHIVVFGAVAAAAAGPWYVRNWVVAGNPLYSLRLGPFAVNAVHDRILQHYNAMYSVRNWNIGQWVSILGHVAALAIVPVAAGIAGGAARFRKDGYLPAGGLLVAAVWIQSVGYTSAGVATSTRVLSPLVVILAIAGGGTLEAMARRRWETAVAAVLGACVLWTAAEGVFFPNGISLNSDVWAKNAFATVELPAEFAVRDQLIPVLGKRVLSDSAYLHAAMADSPVEVVPVWSPEVEFLFSAPPEEADRRLRALGIESVVAYPKTQNNAFLIRESAFYSYLPQRWKVAGQTGDFLFVLKP